MDRLENLKWLRILMILLFIVAIIFAAVNRSLVSLMPLGILTVTVIFYFIFKVGLNRFVEWLLQRDYDQQLTLLEEAEGNFDEEEEEEDEFEYEEEDDDEEDER